MKKNVLHGSVATQ